VRAAHPAPTTTPEELALEVEALGLASGLEAVGIASAEPLLRARAALEERKAAGLHAGMGFTYRNPARSTAPEQLVEGAAAIVVGARRYESILPLRPSRRGPYGQVARYAWTDQYVPLKQALRGIALHLKGQGYRARVLADDNGLVDREVAHRAGLGWFGKNANLLRPGAGSWYVLGSVVTDAPLPTNPSPVEDHCGTCRRCLDGCPTGAIVAPGVVDAGRCLAWLVQAPGTFPRAYREVLGARLYGCDDCQEVCPPNHRVDAVRLRDRSAGSPATESGAWVSLVELLAADDETLLARHGHWYIPGRDPRWLRRNALLALGNAADLDDAAADGADAHADIGPGAEARADAAPGVVATLLRYLREPDPVLRAHAVWACRRLGRDDLLGALIGRDDPEVAEELAAPSPAVRGRGGQQTR
jgi:epoxyqueuosine reductase